MSDQVKLLDVGNSRIKSAVLAHGRLNDIETFAKGSDPQRLLADTQQLFIGAVGQSQWLQALLLEAKEQGVDARQIHTQVESFGLKCGYAQVQNMGVDRWLALLAINAEYSGTFAVLDTGTATTCDFVRGDQHLGGWIAPGFDLMRESLAKNTDKVFVDSQYPTQLSLGTGTQMCVNQGCLAYLRGMLVQAEQQLQRLDSQYRLYVTGGAKALVAEHANSSIVLCENLVLKGLQRFAEA